MCADNFSEERSLILRLIEGDEDAFCELYATYKNRLIYFAMRFLKSREYAEDVFQDAFTVVWQSRRFINPDASFSSYLYTIMRNRILNQLRNAANEERKGSIGINETAALPNYSESILKNIFCILPRFKETHCKVYQTVFISGIQFTKGVLIPLYQAENE